MPFSEDLQPPTPWRGLRVLPAQGNGLGQAEGWDGPRGWMLGCGGVRWLYSTLAHTTVQQLCFLSSHVHHRHTLRNIPVQHRSEGLQWVPRDEGTIFVFIIFDFLACLSRLFALESSDPL